jgi:hypothetical protein
MFVDERMHVPRGAHLPHARGILVHEENGGLRGIPIHQGVYEEEVGDIPCGDVPFLASDQPLVPVPGRGRLDHGRVGPCPLLGYRVGIASLAPARGTEVTVLELLAALTHRERGAPDQVPQRTGRLAHLLLHEDLLEQAEGAAAVLLRVIDRVEALLEDGVVHFLGGFGAEAVVHLAFELEGEEVLLGELAGPLLQSPVFLLQ